MMLTLNDGRAELWQWDTGRTLAVDAECSQVHFSNKVFGRSIDVDVVNGTAIIPDILLQTDKDLNVWAFVGTAENGYTKISKTLTVNRRNKPADYVFTPVDQKTLDDLQSQIGDISDLTTKAKENLVSAINEAAQSGGGGGSTVELDTTLTQSGQAADAAVVGQRLSALSEEIVTTSESKVAAHNTGTDTHSDIRLLIQGLTDRLNALADSDDTTLDQLSEVVTYIKSNRTLIEAITTNKVSVADIIDNLTTNVANKPLSAAQGVALKALIDAISVPDKLPNPNALTFTGAVTGSYDGSEPVTVEIPSGGAYEGIYSLLVEHTITEDVSEVVYTNEEYPGIANLKHILLSIIFPEKHTTNWWKVAAGNVQIISGVGVSNAKHYYGIADVKCGNWIWSSSGSSNDSANQNLPLPSVVFSPKTGYIPAVYNDYSFLRIYGNSFTLPAGTVVRIWGCE